MNARALPTDDVAREPAAQGALGGEDPGRRERSKHELIMHLERDQFVAETSRALPRAALGARATAGLWALRAFVLVVGLMVIYTFIHQL